MHSMKVWCISWYKKLLIYISTVLVDFYQPQKHFRYSLKTLYVVHYLNDLYILNWLVKYSESVLLKRYIHIYFQHFIVHNFHTFCHYMILADINQLIPISQATAPKITNNITHWVCLMLESNCCRSTRNSNVTLNNFFFLMGEMKRKIFTIS